METPDRWIVVTLRDPTTEQTIDKVLAGWYGGYLNGDSWKLNSGISKVEETENYFLFHGYSKSVYKCYKNRYGTTGLTSSILNTIPKHMLHSINKYEVAQEIHRQLKEVAPNVFA
jgi:dihydrodipicolinate synthase/N-acetylneuraminate lyase